MQGQEKTSQSFFNKTRTAVIDHPGLFMFVIALLFLSSLPLFSGNFWLTIVIMVFGTIIAALGIQVLTGYCGQLSSGHSGFIAVGAYTSAILSSKLGIIFWISAPLGALVAGIAGIIIGLASIRLRGFYLIISTIAAQVIIIYVIVHWVALTGGSYGMSAPAPAIGNFSFNRPPSYYYIALAAMIAATYLTVNIVRTNVGRAFIAIRDNELAAESIGINVTLHKLLAFFIGCGLAGLAGAILAHARGVITPDSYTLSDSFYYLGFIIVGGLGTIIGAFFGVLFFTILSQGVNLLLTALASIFPAALSTLGPIMLLILGATMVIFVIIEPMGLAYRWKMFTVRYRIWPFVH